MDYNEAKELYLKLIEESKGPICDSRKLGKIEQLVKLYPELKEVA